MKWTDAHIATLKALRADGVGYTRIARTFGCSRCAVSGAVRRHIHGITDRSPERSHRNALLRRQKRNLLPRTNDWNQRLVEPYAMRKMRLALEKAT